MATIRNRGEYQWEAQIRRKGYPAQRKTFETKADAQAWARMIESEIDRGIFVSRVEAERTAFHQLIDRYISEIAPKHKGAYSEIKRLEALKRHPLATRIVATLTSSDFARYRDERLKIRKGNTVKRELALFQCVIEVARREWGIHLAENPVRMVSRPSYNDERSRRLDPVEEQYILSVLNFGPGVCGRYRARMWCGLVGFVETSKPGDFSEGEKYSSNIGHLACKGCIERSVPHVVGWRKPLQEHSICNHVTRKPKNCTW